MAESKKAGVPGGIENTVSTAETSAVTSGKATETLENAEKTGFDVKKALDTAGFVEFLAAHPDMKENHMSDAGLLEKKFETFNLKEGVKKDMEKLFSEQIKTEIGIDLNTEEQGLIGKHLENIAITEPETLKELSEKLREMNKLPTQIAQKEAELADLCKGRNLEESLKNLTSFKDDLNLANQYVGPAGSVKSFLKGTALTFRGIKYVLDKRAEKEPYTRNVSLTGFGNDTIKIEPKQMMTEAYAAYKRDVEQHKSIKDAVERVKTEYGVTSKISSKGDINGLLSGLAPRLDELNNTIANVREAEQKRDESKKSFEAVRKELLADVSCVKGLEEAIQSHVKQQMKALVGDLEDGKVGPRTIQSLDIAQEMLEKFTDFQKKSDTGLHPLEGANMDGSLQEFIDKGLEELVTTQINEKVADAKLGDNAFTKLKDSLKPFLEREKIGSQEGDAARDVIAKALKEAITGLSDKKDAESRAKILLLSRIVTDLHKK